MISFIRSIIPVDAEYEARKQKAMEEIKKLTLEKVKGIPATESEINVLLGEQKAFGKNAKAAENYAIEQNSTVVPFYEDVCNALLSDNTFVSKLPRGARFEVEELIKRDRKTQRNFTQLIVVLNWAPRLRCNIL